MKNKLIILLLATLTGLAACKEDFIETTDPNSLTTSTFPTTKDHLNLMLNGLYANQHAFGLFGHNLPGKNLYSFDHTQDMSWIAFQYWNDQHQNNTKPNNVFMEETWRDTWKGVQRSNALLAGLETFRQQSARPDDAADLQLIEGQARFLRAWFYYYLINFWGESFITNGGGGDRLGVPIITGVANELAITQQPRATVRQVWDFIISDLQAAETLLGNKTGSGNDQYRAGIWSVKGFLGKAYVYTQEWTNARTYLKDVVDNSGKSLLTFDTYKDMFNGKNEFNTESIVEINFNVDRTGWGAWGDQSTGSGTGMIIGPCFVNDKGGTDGSGWSNVFPHDKNLTRFGFNEPVPTDKTNPAYLTRSRLLKATKQVDPRLWVACLQPYADSMTADGKQRAIAPYKDVPATFHAWSFRKYVNLEGTEYAVNVNNGSNFHWLRLADVYLLYAEALSQSGDNATALEYINKVKRRAYSLPVNAVSAVDYKNLTDATESSDPVLRADPLKYERWAELFGEGSWWFDVCRWKIGAQEANYYQAVRGGAINWSDGRSYAQPIPQSEIEANSQMRQNPGY